MGMRVQQNAGEEQNAGASAVSSGASAGMATGNPYVAVGVAAISLIGGIMGNNANKKAQAKAEAALAQARAYIEQVGPPPDISKAIILEKLKEAGVLTPDLEQKINVGVSKLSEYQEAAQGRDAQVNALQLMSRASREGIGATERADLNKLRTQAAMDAEAKRQQLMQSLQSRGIAGSGSELASQLAMQQQGYQTASDEGDRMAAQAQTRALQAMAGAASAGQQLRGSDLAHAQATRGAADEFQKFDVANQVSQQSRNVGATNVAQASNLQNKQRVQDQNTTDQNEEKYKQVKRQQDYWNDKLKYAQALANPTGGSAAYDREIAKGNQEAASKSGLANAIGSGLASIYQGSK
jgi:hypothetical protein